MNARPVRISIAPDIELAGDLAIPEQARGIVVFAHGSGSGRHSPRNRAVAASLQQAGLATLLLDLLTADEEVIDLRTREFRFDIGLLAHRLAGATAWLRRQPEAQRLAVGYFGASTGAAAALIAAADDPQVRAVVSRGGRVDLAGEALSRVRAPTLMIVGGDDAPVIELNQEAMRQLRCPVELEIVPGASHLFEEPGTLEAVTRLSAAWFTRHLGQAAEAG